MDFAVFLNVIMYEDLVVGDLEHTCFFNCGRCSLLAINFTIPWYIWSSGFGSLRVYVSCSLNIVAYLGRKENSSMPNVLWGSWARMLGESLGMLHVDFFKFDEEFI
jgi:hypothetical protein